jgi:RecA/RadA recombinase
MTFALFSPILPHMASAAAIRLQVETNLAKRVPAALTLKFKQAPELFATGIAEIDAMLGGIPRGSITEISGASSTGKTSFGLASIAAITRSGAVCAWVDVGDMLSPESAAAASVQLKRLLWLRMTPVRKQRGSDKPWTRLEQALKATDLLLQAGGFAAVVLDMSDVLAQHTMRIPLATWYRLRLAAEHARTALVLLTQAPCASSCAALVVRCKPPDAQPFRRDDETALFEGQRYTLVRERNRTESTIVPIKKPSARAAWRAETLWTRMR